MATRESGESPQRENGQSFQPPAIPDHELVRIIGSGSYGDVWLARNIVGTYRAIKVVYRSRFKDIRPFEREFEGIQKFEPVSRTHEGLIDILQIGRNEQSGYFYCVMELADDASSVTNIDYQIQLPVSVSRSISDSYRPRTLASDIERFGRLPVRECIQRGLSLSIALEFLHNQSLVHRDVKPSNIIFVNGTPKLADIGLVAEAGDGRSLVGTIGFMPPEGPGSFQADVFSLGKVLYEASTGKDREQWPRPITQLASIDDREEWLELNEVIKRACESDLRKRYKDASELRGELALLLGGKSVVRLRALERVQKTVLLAAIPTLITVIALVFVLQAQSKIQKQRVLAESAEGKRLQAERLVYQRRLLEEVQSEWLLPHYSGWFITNWNRMKLAADIAIDDDVRNHAAGLLMGLDAQLVAQETNFGATDVHFDGLGQKLLTARSGEPSHILDAISLVSKAEFPGQSLGVAGFWPGNIPVQLEFERTNCSIAVRGLGNTAVELCRLDISVLTQGKSCEMPKVVKFAQNGSVIAAIIPCAETNIVAAWDAGSKQVLFQELVPASAIAISSNGAALAIADAQGQASVVFIGTKERKTISIETGQKDITTLAFHVPTASRSQADSDGLLLAVGDNDGKVSVWDIERKFQFPPCLAGTFTICALAFNSDGSFLVAGGSGSARVWDVATGKRLLNIYSWISIRAFDFSPDGTKLVIGVTDSFATPNVQIWSLQRGSGVSTLHGNSKQVEKIAFSADSLKIAALSEDWKLCVWNRTNHSLIRRFRVERADSADNSTIAFSPDGKRIAFCAGRRATLWDIETGAIIDSIELPEAICDTMDFDESGSATIFRFERINVNSTSRRACIRTIFDESALSRVVDLPFHYSRIYDVALSASRHMVTIEGIHAAGKDVRDITAFDTTSGNVKWSVPSRRTWNWSSIRPDPNQIILPIYTDDSDSTSLLDISSGRLLQIWPASVSCVGPEAKIAATIGSRGFERGISLVNPRTNKKFVTLAMDVDLNGQSLKFDLSGNFVACGTLDGTVLVCDLAQINSRLSQLGLQWQSEE